MEYDNNKLTNAKLRGHREIITEDVKKGYEPMGFIPVSFGPSGKRWRVILYLKKSFIDII